jgi:peptide chain release factor 1
MGDSVIQRYNIDLVELRDRLTRVEARLAQHDLDQATRMTFQKEYAQVGFLYAKALLVDESEKRIERLKAEHAQTHDADLLAMLQEEQGTAQHEYDQAVRELDDLLFPPDETDKRSVFLEIRAGTGGQEAALFAADLSRMYTLYAQVQGWRVSVASFSTTDLGGYREVILHIEGKGVYGKLKRESGVHRVQRVPATETQGRIHTSTATVAVLPEADEVEVAINPADLRIDVYRASGAGGQHVNTTDSAVRVTHIPSGMVVACQDERSQHKNKAKALKVLQARLKAFYEEKHAQQESAARKEQVGSGERAEKVRTYNFPQNRVTDHQVGLTLNKLDRVMEGDMGEIVDALTRDEALQRRARALTAALA